MKKKLKRKIIEKIIKDKKTNKPTLNAILRDKYPEFDNVGAADYYYILVTKEPLELIKAISKLQSFYYDIDPNNTENIETQMCKLFFVKELKQNETPLKYEYTEKFNKIVNTEYFNSLVREEIKRVKENDLKEKEAKK
jgi:hypothetical protein